MILGATHLDIWSALIVLVVALLLGFVYIGVTFLRLITKNTALCFIYDMIYGILVDGVFFYLVLKFTMGDIKYYHILSLTIGIFLAGVLPSSLLKSHHQRIDKWADKMRSSKIYTFIKK